MSDEQHEQDIERLKEELKGLDKIKDGLLEHWDSVQIFVTRYRGGDKGGTDRIYVGGGNWFARYGQIRCWLLREDAETSAIDDSVE